LVVLGLGGLLVLGIWVNAVSEKDAARAQAHIQIDSLKAVHCTPDIAEEFDRINTARFEGDLEKSTLDLEEKQMLEAAFASAMELSGCGINSRYKVKPASRRARSR
jgi:hypothetical protein